MILNHSIICVHFDSLRFNLFLLIHLLIIKRSFVSLLLVWNFIIIIIAIWSIEMWRKNITLLLLYCSQICSYCWLWKICKRWGWLSNFSSHYRSGFPQTIFCFYLLVFHIIVIFDLHYFSFRWVCIWKITLRVVVTIIILKSIPNDSWLELILLLWATLININRFILILLCRWR